MKFPYPAHLEDQSRIDLTPMLDVVFIMLIFFVVTATFLHERGVPVTAPSNVSTVSPEVESIIVTVEPAGIFNVNGRLLAKDSLAPYVRALKLENPDASYSVLVIAEAKARDTVVAVDAGRMLGLDVIPIAKVE